jgi:hypothetical protein
MATPLPLPVLSNTGWRGKPDVVWVGVSEGVCDGVGPLLCVPEPERVALVV